LPEEPLQAVARGCAAEVPLLIGTTRDELSLFALGDPRINSLDDDGLLEWLARVAPQMDPAVLADSYRATRARRGESLKPVDLWVGIGSDLVFRWPSLRMAAAQRAHQRATFVYLFTWETPAFGGSLGACHALELPFVFGSLHRPVIAAIAGAGPQADELSANMQTAWLRFARDSDPSHEGIGTWPDWEPSRRATMVFGPGGGVREAPRDEELAVLAATWPIEGTPLVAEHP